MVEAAAAMLRHEIRPLLVRNHRGRVVGLVSMRELMGALLYAVDPLVWSTLRETLSANPNTSVEQDPQPGSPISSWAPGRSPRIHRSGG